MDLLPESECAEYSSRDWVLSEVVPVLSTAGLEVARHIPVEMIPGILSGAYSVHGGVIRDGLGRIVSHLAMGSGIANVGSLVPQAAMLGMGINTAQLYMVGRDIKQVQETVNTVLSVSMAGTALSGLGLVTSIAGFAYLSKRLTRIDAKLSQLERQIKEIRSLIQSQHKAQLYTAIDCLRQSEVTTNEYLRRELLMQSKSGFTTQAHYYRELWANAAEIHEIDGIDEYFSLAFMGAAIATSELGMADVAEADLRHHYEQWRLMARRHCGTQLMGNDPQRLLDGELVKELPARELTSLLDFVNGTNRGIDWIDDLRSQPSSLSRFALSSLPGALKRSPLASEKPRIEFGRRLRARDDVLEANVAHFAFLAENKLSAGRFASDVKLALEESRGEPICIYREARDSAVA